MRDVPRSIPLIKVWNNERIMRRNALEAESGFGVGNVVPPIVYVEGEIEDERVATVRAQAAARMRTIDSFQVCVIVSSYSLLHEICDENTKLFNYCYNCRAL